MNNKQIKNKYSDNDGNINKNYKVNDYFKINNNDNYSKINNNDNYSKINNNNKINNNDKINNENKIEDMIKRDRGTQYNI